MADVKHITINEQTYDIRDATAARKGMYVGTCPSSASIGGSTVTMASSPDKVVTVDTFPTDANDKPLVGTIIGVKYATSNTYKTDPDNNKPEAPHRINVNNTGYIQIYYNNAALKSGTSANTLAAGYKNRYIFYQYDGTYWVWLSAGTDTNTTYYGYSFGLGLGVQNNASASATITVTLTNYALATGGVTAVRFLYDVPANSTMNINSKGAKSIYYKNSAITAGIIKAGDTATFVYSGQYHLISIDRWDTDIKAKANSADLATVATSGSYNDLSDKPTIPAAVIVDSSLTGSSQTNPVQGGAIYSALQGKEDKHIILNLEEDANDNLVFTDLDGNTIAHTQVLGWLQNKSASVMIDYDGTVYEMQTGGEELWRGIYYDGDYFAYINLQGADYPITTLEFEDKGEIYLASHNWAQNRFVPTSRKVNNKPLSTDITLTASDVGALPSTTTIPTKVSDLTNDSGFITGYTETDPVFAASAAHGISSADIASWDAKADPVPIVTVSTTGAVTQALDPNKFYNFTGSPTSLTLTLTSGTGLCIYAGKFTAGTGFSNFTLPSTVKVADSAPSVEAGGVYEFSVMNNLLLLAKEGA